jgi:hypothetical protein
VNVKSRGRIEGNHVHRMIPIPSSDDAIARDKIAKRMPSCDIINRRLAHVAAKLRISARAAASDKVCDSISSIVDLTFKFSDEHPATVHETAQICKGILRWKMPEEPIAH